MDKSLHTNQILNNSLILENIFRYLNFKDHLKLVRVCREFRETIVHFIWRCKCKELRVTQRDESYVVTIDDSEDYNIEWKYFYEFFKLNRFNIQKLSLRECNHKKLMKIIEGFKNLIALEMQYCTLSETTIVKIADNSPNLRILTFDHCYARNCNSEIILGQHLKVDTLAHLMSLRELRIFNQYKAKMDYETIKEIAKHLKLTHLSLRSSIFYEGSERMRDLITSESNSEYWNLYQTLEHLDIGRLSNRSSWLMFLRLHLPKFRNLQDLSIFIDMANCVLINDDIAIMISNACPRLRNLSFKQCKFRLQNFTLPFALEQLSLDWCWGLKWENFQQIFCNYRLEKFTSINSHYDGNDIPNFYTSEFLQVLSIETSPIQDFVDSLSPAKSLFPMVTNFHWLNSSDCCHIHPQEMRQQFSKIFPNLQELYLEQSYLSIREFERLTYLQVLQISLFDGITWPYLLTLLQSSTLRKLTIDMPMNLTTSLCPILTPKPDWHLKLFPIDFSRNFQYLKIPLRLFRNALEFWLDFLSRQRKRMTLKFFDCFSHEIFDPVFLKTLLNANKFPLSRNTINICKFVVDCESLRRNFEETMKAYEFTSDNRGYYYIEI
ncbi:uncharacterized protein LOC142236416 [Haematobia irritans]|uniref:uncharacterized protein LOC142236416 n=1 Tax=Haematobia irritans TaxID=7368 RepID=UPI003F500FFD